MRARLFNDGVLRLEWSGAPVARSDFPDPLVTVDYGKNDAGEEIVVGITLVGSATRAIAQIGWPGPVLDMLAKLDELSPLSDTST